MKKLLALTIASLFICAYPVHAQKSAPKLPKFIHGTYSVVELLSEAELSDPGYDAFNFIYLMATPQWTKIDFDQPLDKIIEVADEFDYLKAGGNMPLIPRMIEKAHKSKAKILLSFGGHEIFDPVVFNPERRVKFMEYMVRLVENNDYDGIDIDWEITLDKEVHADMMSILRDRLNKLSQKTKRYYFLTTALSIDHVYDQKLADKLSSVIDWVNIMSYDMCDGIWGGTPSHNTSMEKMRSKLEHWNTFDKKQLCLGLANYGFYYKGGLKPGVQAPGPLRDYGKYITYKEFIPKMSQGWTEEYDPTAEVSYYFSPDRSEFVTMDSPSSILNKIEWMTANKYRGAFWWEYHHDFAPAGKDNPRSMHPLIDVSTKYLKIKKK